ncbi:MAG: hypothetical protein JSW18_01710 [Candidatus Omnitrophota bacterium]|nr:MAG: hypothetical protein JSW18_01710 [Candidatus Omnitrophota bacterium]
MKKLLIWLFIFLLVAFFTAFKARNTIVKSILVNSVKSLTDLRITVGDINADIGKHNIDVKHLRLYNPAGFEEAVMADIPFAYLDYNPGAAILRKVHFNILKIDLKELLIVRNRTGHLNFMSIKSLQKPGMPKKKTGAFKIDRLYLSIGKVIYKDYYKNRAAVIKVYNIGLRNQLFKNVDDPKALVSTIMYKALMQTDIYQLINFNMNILKEDLTEVMDIGGVIIKDFSQDASQTIKDTAKDIKNTIKDIFVKEKP